MKLFVSCDINYFEQHGIEFCKSAIANGNKVLAIVFNTLNETVEQQIATMSKCLIALKKEIEDKTLDIRPIEPKLYLDLVKALDIKDNRALYACMRFIMMPAFMDELPYLIVDIDSIVNKEVKVDEQYDLGLYLRENNEVGGSEYEVQGMKIAAGSVYVTPKSKVFIQLVHDYLISHPIEWFADQHALYNSYKTIKNTYNITDFSKYDPPFMDWEFKNPDAVIYTGKGDRKYNNKLYLDIKEKWK